jgi:anaerobic ribonucleoside-triphosphate reductase
MSKRLIPCEVYSRVVGYYRPVQNWNVGKRQEFSERTTYDKAVKKRRKRGDEQN